MKRNISKGMLFGVCAGLADELKVEVVFVRAALLFLTFMGFGTPAIIYLILAIVMPTE